MPDPRQQPSRHPKSPGRRHSSRARDRNAKIWHHSRKSQERTLRRTQLLKLKAEAELERLEKSPPPTRHQAGTTHPPEKTIQERRGREPKPVDPKEIKAGYQKAIELAPRGRRADGAGGQVAQAEGSPGCLPAGRRGTQDSRRNPEGAAEARSAGQKQQDQDKKNEDQQKQEENKRTRTRRSKIRRTSRRKISRKTTKRRRTREERSEEQKKEEDQEIRRSRNESKKSDEQKQEQKQPQPQVSRDRIEEALRKVRERQQEKRERDRKMKARVLGSSPRGEGLVMRHIQPCDDRLAGSALCCFPGSAGAACRRSGNRGRSRCRARSYIGESVDYVVEIRNVKNPAPPDLSALRQDFDVVATGDESHNQSSTFIFNGRVTQQNIFGHVYRFRLTPKRTGKLVIPAPSATVDGKTMSGRSLASNVIAPEAQDLVVPEIKTDRAASLSHPAVRGHAPRARPPACRTTPIAIRLTPLRRRPPHIDVNWVDLPAGLVRRRQNPLARETPRRRTAADSHSTTSTDAERLVFRRPAAGGLQPVPGAREPKGLDGRPSITSSTS